MALLRRKLEINDRFRHALHVMEKTDRSLFITGRAGTGKSTLLSHFCARTNKRPVVLAPTGVAALNVKGQTIHKFFNFYIDVTPEKIRAHKIKPRNPKLYAKLRTIIIDEISMVRADLLDCVDEFLRIYGPQKDKPFGGVQMIFVGDLYQLPPVVREEDEAYSSRYETPFFFSARSLQSADFAVVELDTIYRQKEQEFVDLLNRVRTNEVEEADLRLLNSRYQPGYRHTGKGFFINLTATNRKADEINARHLEALSSKLHTTKAKIDGEFGPEYYPTATELQFKIGAQVMLINNDTQGRWVNGSIGEIVSIKRDDDDRAYINVRLEDEGELVQVYPHTWEVFKYGVDGGEITAHSIGSFTQFPFRLAWAVTIHKSQGKTFDHVIIDMDRGAFASGQVYVALSRCTTFEGIVLSSRIERQHIMTDPRIEAFLTAHAYEPPDEPLVEDAALEREVSAAEAKTPAVLKTQSAEARRVLAALAQGKNPISGEAFASDSPYVHPDILAALQCAMNALEGQAPGGVRPAKEGARWSAAEREALIADCNAGMSSRDMADKYGRSRSAIRSELAKHGLAPAARKTTASGEPLPENAGKAWAEEDRTRAGEAFREGRNIQQIAEELRRTSGSILAELMKQGLISPENFNRNVA